MAIARMGGLMLLEGEPAPLFDLPSSDGDRVKLRPLRGGPVVLYFYPADDTSACTLEAQRFEDLRGEFLACGARIVGVSPDGIASHCKFRDKYSLGFSLASDEDLTVCKAYGVWTEKLMFGRRYMGVERTTVLIDARGAVACIWRKVRVPGHAEKVLAALKSLAVVKR